MCTFGHVVANTTDSSSGSVTIGVVVRIQSNPRSGSKVLNVFNVGALPANTTEIITTGIIQTITRIRRISMAGITGTATHESVAIIDGISAVIVTYATDRTTVVAIR